MNIKYPLDISKKIIKYDIKSGIYPGAIAGFIGGIPIEIGNILFFNRLILEKVK